MAITGSKIILTSPFDKIQKPVTTTNQIKVLTNPSDKSMQNDYNPAVCQMKIILGTNHSPLSWLASGISQ